MTILDFIGNSYKRSVQIAFALSSLAENFVLEKRLMRSLVSDDFHAIGLTEYGVEIHIDDLSKEEIIDYLEKENFNSLNYMKQDYFNFCKYIGAETYPSHMDYLNNDAAPDLLRFMSIKIGGKKTVSYYNFLHGIVDGEEKMLPVFSERQIAFAGYLSAMLPLVRPHEYLIVRSILEAVSDTNDINRMLSMEVSGYDDVQFQHAVEYMLNSGFITQEVENLALNVVMDSDFREYLFDLLKYGLTRYDADYGTETGFKLWQSYRMDQVQLKLLKNPKYTMKGTYVYGENVIIFASIKKDASIQEHLNYKDKFLQPDLFQWECEAGLSAEKQAELIQSRKAYLFIRKVESENGIVMPFTYVGEGIMKNPRKTSNPKGTLLFDIYMDSELPDYLQYDFGLLKE